MKTRRPDLAEADQGFRRSSSPRAMSLGTYIAAQAHIDTTDQVAAEMEAKWGCGRLRLLVPADLAEKFDRQRYLWNQAIWYGDLEAVRTQSTRMIAAWRKLDQVASAAGAQSLSPKVWEMTLQDGTVMALVQNNTDAQAVVAQGRQVAVYSLDEIRHMLEDYRRVTEAKLTWPGATVTAIRRPGSDPLDAVIDTEKGLDEVMDDDMPSFGGTG